MGNKPTDSDYSSKNNEKKAKKNITSPDQLENTYPNLWEAYGQETDLTITGEHLTGNLFIENNSKIRTLNVGNNKLSYLVVRKCPQLHTLRYAYNQMDDHDAFIDWDSCPNLRPENIDKYGYDGSVPWGDNEEFSQQDKEKDGKEQFNEKLKRAKEKNKQEKLREELYKIIIEMLVKAEKYADQGDWEGVELSLVAIKETLLKSQSHLSQEQLDEIKERINKLEQRMLNSQSIQPQSIAKIVVGLSFGVLITLGILAFFANKMIKNLLAISNYPKFFKQKGKK